jgi:hypothetical protein
MKEVLCTNKVCLMEWELFPILFQNVGSHSTRPHIAGDLNFDVRGSVHHSVIHKEKSNKLQQCIKILLFQIYMKLNMFRAKHRPSSGV